MSEHTAIEWTDSTWTPIRARCWEIQDDGSGKERIGWHCEHVSEGCRNCYAEGINRRLGTGYDYKPGNLRGKPGYYGGGIERPEIFLDEKMLLAPLKWKKPRMIFVCSMTDLFADFVTDEMILRILDVIRRTSWDGGSNCGKINNGAGEHTYQVLTKRSGRMAAFMKRLRWRRDPDGGGTMYLADDNQPALVMKNLWLGVSAEDQKTADERIPDLLQTPAAVRFVSLEPLLGAITLPLRYGFPDHIDRNGNGHWSPPQLDWIIVGGESGPHGRPMHPDWPRAIRDQCVAAGTAFFFKQWGGKTPKSAGRLLDGKVWDQMPEGKA